MLYEYGIASLVLCEINSTHNPTQTNQPTTQPQHNTMTCYYCQYLYGAVQEIRPSRWVSKSWNLFFEPVVKHLLRAFYFVLFLIIGISKIYVLFFWSRAILFLIHIFFERSEFQIDTSQKKGLCVCSTNLCFSGENTNLGFSVGYVLCPSYVCTWYQPVRMYLVSAGRPQYGSMYVRTI